jgi:hypothetical protein
VPFDVWFIPMAISGWRSRLNPSSTQDE